MSQEANGSVAAKQEQISQFVRIMQQLTAAATEANRAMSSVFSTGMSGAASSSQLRQGIDQLARSTTDHPNVIDAVRENIYPTVTARIGSQGRVQQGESIAKQSAKALRWAALEQKRLDRDPNDNSETMQRIQAGKRERQMADAVDAYVEAGMGTASDLVDSMGRKGITDLNFIGHKINPKSREMLTQATSMIVAPNAKRDLLSQISAVSNDTLYKIGTGELPSYQGLDVYDTYAAGKSKLDVPALERQIKGALASDNSGARIVAREAQKDLEARAEFKQQYQKAEVLAEEAQLKASAAGATEKDTKFAAAAVEALKELGQALNTVEKQAKKASKELKEFDGGEGGGGGPTFSEQAKKTLMVGAKILTGATSVAIGGLTAYSALDVAAKSEMLGKEGMLSENLMRERGLRQATAISRFSLEDPVNLFKQAGDVLFPGMTKYAGVSGRETGIAEGTQLGLDQLGLSKALLTKARWGAAGQAAGGVAQVAGGIGSAIGGGPMGMAIGASTAAAGMGSMSNALTGYLSTQVGNEWAQLQGGTIKGIAGWTQDMTPEQIQKASRLNANVILSAKRAQALQYHEEKLNQEVQANPILVTAMQEYQKMVSVRQRGVELVGTHAWTEKDIVPALYSRPKKDALMDSLYGPIAASATSIRADDPVDAEAKRRALYSDVSPVSLKGLGSLEEDYRRQKNLLDPNPNTLQHMEREISAKKATIDAARNSTNSVTPWSLEFLETVKNAPTTRQTYASERGMSIPEYQGTANMVSNFVNTSGKIGLEKVNSMIDLSRSGLGDMSALLGNLSAMNRISGGQDNIEQLKMVLGTAVSMGFDRSRTAQQFVQTTQGVAEALKLTRVDLTGAHLKDSAKWQSATLKADERSLAQAAQGMTAYDQLTSSKTGVFANVKAIRLMGAGASTGVLSRMQNVSESDAKEIMNDLDKFGSVSKGADYQWTRNTKGSALMSTIRSEMIKEKGLDKDNTTTEQVSAFLNQKSTTEELKKRMSTYLGSATNMIEPFLNKEFDNRVAAALVEKKKKYKEGTPEYKARLVTVRDLVYDIGTKISFMDQVSDEAGIESSQRWLESKGVLDASKASSVNAKVRAATKIWSDPAQIKMAAATGEILNRTIGRSANIGLKGYTEMLNKNEIAAMPVTVGGQSVPLTRAMLDYRADGSRAAPIELAGTGITHAQLASTDIDRQLQSYSAMDWSRSKEFQAAPSDAQSVRIINASDIGAAVALAQRDANIMSSPSSVAKPKGVTEPVQTDMKQPVTDFSIYQ